MSADCLFCKIVRGEIPAKLAYQDEDYVAFHDINPQAPTHILIIPRKHIRTLNDLEPDDAQLVGGMLLLAGRLAAERGIAAPGYRAVFNCNAGAGQSVWHVHLHLLGGRPLHWPPG
ncbi:MAG: histidine triad nucleotide-binding protein [bacterium]|nr:histidine triad nucleotide-binding protein [bacterium]